MNRSSEIKLTCNESPSFSLFYSSLFNSFKFISTFLQPQRLTVSLPQHSVRDKVHDKLYFPSSFSTLYETDRLHVSTQTQKEIHHTALEAEPMKAAQWCFVVGEVRHPECENTCTPTESANFLFSSDGDKMILSSRLSDEFSYLTSVVRTGNEFCVVTFREMCPVFS